MKPSILIPGNGHQRAMLRKYWPKEKSPSILNGTWMPTKVVKID
jgi:hypothetical protein